MAPISEKRSQPLPPPPHHKEGGHGYVHLHHGHGHGHGHSHAKENAATKHSKRGLEILDFHESWLEEMEIYKDKMYVHKQLPQLLGSHNHTRMSQGSKSESQPHSKTNQNLSNIITNLLNVSGLTVSNTESTKQRNKAAAASVSEQITSSSSSSNNNHNNANHSSASSSRPQRIVVRSAQVAAASSPSTEAKQSVGGNVHRPREETSPSKTAAAGSSNNASKRQVQTQNSHLSTSQTHGQNTAKTGSAVTPPPSSKPATKIVVNKFHASSLLSSQHYEEKAKILTENGLTKSAATAYATSMYASHYLPQDNRLPQSVFNGARNPNGDYNNYVGVSLVNFDRSKDSQSPTNAEDDPCAAIDDVTGYTDSDSEEEYTGSPFYLEEDGNETHQSRNIRYQTEVPVKPSADEKEKGKESEHTEYYRPKSILSPSIFPNVPPYLNFSSHAGKGPAMPAALHKILKWKLSPVMPKIVKRVVLNSGFRIIKNTTDWMAIWEKHMKSPGFRTIRSHQKYNHMPGSFRIGRKDTMWRSLYNNMKRYGTKEFGFMQKSYIMPDDLESLRQVWPKNASKLTKWIVKPPASARGTGIRIVNKWSQFPKDRPLVVQKYIERPLLINDNKFDMRIYVVVTSINPLRIYMYKDGLARFASVKYSSELNSLDDRCMHLTNYSINKFSQNYSKNEDFNACQGHKWTLQSLWSCLEARGVNTKRLWATLRNLVIKAIVSGESGLNRMYRQNVNFRYNCFELFGFDVLLDENLIPWLLEINISPSLHSELPLDLHVKGPLIQAVLNTALYQVPPKLNEKQQKDILDELKLTGPLCHDKRIFTTCLTAEEVRKHNHFTNRSIEFREEYLDAILENLLPDDVRCLIVAEDEYHRSKPLERIFPTPKTHSYLKFIDNPRYYNRLLDAWEHKYGEARELGIAKLRRYCEDDYHLQVSDAALEKEPNVTLTEIDMLHTKKSEDLLTPTDSTAGDNASANASKAGSPELPIELPVVAPIPCAKEDGHSSKPRS